MSIYGRLGELGGGSFYDFYSFAFFLGFHVYLALGRFSYRADYKMYKFTI